MDTDRLLSIHQSVNLAVLRKQNKYMLGIQAEQCGQIMQLRRQIDASNDMTRQILKNQLNAIQHQENLKYYKNVVYNMKEAVNAINKTEDTVFRFFLNTLFHDMLKLQLQEAKDNLEEISDKVFCSEIENELETNKEQILSAKEKYLGSTFHTLLESEKNYKEQRLQLIEKKKSLILNEKKYLDETKRMEKPDPIDKYLSYMILLGICSFIAIWIPGGFIFLIFSLIMIPFLIKKNKKWKKNYPAYLEDFKQKEALRDANSPYLNAKKECDALEVQLSTHPYIKAKYDLSLEYPVWENMLEKITSYFPNPKEEKDPLLYKIAKCMVENQTTDMYKIRQTITIGRLRFDDVTEKLEAMGIVDMKARKVKIQTVELLDKYWPLVN